jgi:hypothetical protein
MIELARGGGPRISDLADQQKLHLERPRGV